MADTPPSDLTRRQAKIVDRHLPEGYSAAPETSFASRVPHPNGEEVEESSLMLQGGDMHRDIFKIQARAKAPRRSNTFSHGDRTYDDDEESQPGPAGADIQEHMQPGGFRRAYIQRRFSSVATPVTSNFISFLELYGSFAGEDLEDTDFDDDEEESLTASERAREDERPTDERRPLLSRRKTSKRSKAQGDATTTKTFFTLLKAFVGTGIMFLPKAFRNGGILFSSMTMIVVSIVTSLCFRLLLQCRSSCGGGGYGEIGGEILGKKFRTLVLSSIALSQLGFVCAGLIFTAENLMSFLNAVVPDDKPQPFGTASLIALQFVVLIPMALIRNISKLGPAALLADVFILIGLVYIWYFDISTLATNGIATSVNLFNPSSFTLTIGSAIFTFEGIGLILPIQSSMKKPEHFSKLLYLVMFLITVIFTSIGALCYATFGDQTNVEVISNFPQDSKLVNAVQFLYSMAVLVGSPVQLFPAVRIIETTLFGERATGKKSAAIKWKKNALRTTALLFCGGIAIFGASDLDKFVALIGAVACVPLVYIYPPFMHLRGVAVTRFDKAWDIGMMALGIVAMVYCTVTTLMQWSS
jgi:proton-coupled amino acid transporter